MPLGPPKILVVEHAELLAVRSLSLNPVLGAVVRYVKHATISNCNSCQRKFAQMVGANWAAWGTVQNRHDLAISRWPK